MVEVNVKVESAGTHNVHNNAFYAEEELLKSELQAMRDCDPSSARHWIVRALFASGHKLMLFLPPGWIPENCTSGIQSLYSCYSISDGKYWPLSLVIMDSICFVLHFYLVFVPLLTIKPMPV